MIDNNNHSTNPTLSIILGALLTAGNTLYNIEIDMSNVYDIIFQILKVICFGTLGGFVGFFGKLIAEKVNNKFKS